MTSHDTSAFGRRQLVACLSHKGRTCSEFVARAYGNGLSTISYMHLIMDRLSQGLQSDAVPRISDSNIIILVDGVSLAKQNALLAWDLW